MSAYRFPLEELIREAEREVAMRERVYPNRVRARSMSADEAEAKTEMMRQIVDRLRELHDLRYAAPQTDLFGGEG